MAGRAGAAGSRRNSGVGPKKQQQEPWPEEISLKLNRYAMMQAYLLMGVTGIGYLALTWSTVVLLGGFVTALGKKDFWCLTFISMIQAAGIFEDQEEGVMLNFVEQVALILLDVKRNIHLKRTILLLPIVSLLFPVLLVGLVLYDRGSFICVRLALWRVIQRDYGNMVGDSTKANLIPALDLFYSLILCQGALFFLWSTSGIVALFFVNSLNGVREFPKKWVTLDYLDDTRSKFWRVHKSMMDMRLIKYAVDLLDSESSQDYLSGARMLDVFIKHDVDVRPLILPSNQKVQKLIDTLRWSSSDREIKELAARILAHLACDIDLTQFPGAIRCISSLLGTTLPYWNNQQGSSNESPQKILVLLFEEMINKSKLDQQGAGDSEGDRGTTQPYRNNQQGSSNQSPQSKLDQQGAGDSEGDRGTTQPYRNNQQGSSNQSPQSKLDQQGAGDSEGDCWNELILQGLTILERLASDQHNCRDICSTPDLIAKIMSPIYSDTLIQDINIMPAWQDVVNGAFRVVHRLIRAPEWTGGRRLAHEISCSKQAVSNLERILDQGNTASQQLQMRAMEVLTELALDPAANVAMETKKNLINKQLQIFLDEGTEEDLRVTAGTNSSANLAMETEEKLINKQLQEDLRVTAGKTLVLLSKTGTLSLCIISDYNHIVDQVTGTKKKAIYRTIAAEILENLCTLSLNTMDKNHVKNTLLPKVLAEVLTSQKKPPSEALERQVSKVSGDIEGNPLQDDEENQLLDHNGQINSAEQKETQTAMMELKEALLSLTSVIFDQLIISAEDFDDVAQKVAPGEGEFVAKLKTIVKENCEATASSLRIVKPCGQIAVTMMRRSQYSAHFKEQNFVETLSKASRIMCNLESCMLFAGTDGGVKKTARPLLSDLVKEAQALVA